MIRLGLSSRGADRLSVLCLGAHSDDIEIGCGATLLQFKESMPHIRFHWVVFSATGIRGEEAKKAAGLFTAGRESKIYLKEYRDGFLPYVAPEVKEFFEELKSQVEPDLIFTHWSEDAHQDHRLVSELTWNTFRNHLILEYEVPKYDGDLGRPNVYVPSLNAFCSEKIDHLFTAFGSQQSKRWFERETFLGLMRIRGMECNAESGYAEAFHSKKLVLE